MKVIYTYFKDGEPSRTTHRSTLTERISANTRTSANLILKIHRQHNFYICFEEVAAIVKSMEHDDGKVLAARMG